MSCSEAGGDFAFILDPSSSLRLIDTRDVDGVPEDADFDAAKFDEWMRMRILDVLREERENSASPVTRRQFSPSDFLFEASSRSMILVRRDGAVFERKVSAGREGVVVWRLTMRLPTQDIGNDVLQDAAGMNHPFFVTSTKRERFLAYVRGGEDVSVFNLTDGGSKLTSTGEDSGISVYEEDEPVRHSRFCLGRMPFPLLFRPRVGLFKVAVEATKNPEDSSKRGFVKILSDVDDLVRGKSGTNKEELAKDISALTSKARPNAFLRTVKQDLLTLAETLKSFDGQRTKFVEANRICPADRLTASDRLVDELRRNSVDGSVEGESLCFLLHQLEFLSHSVPVEVVSSLLRLLHSESNVGDGFGGCGATSRNILFASVSSSSSSALGTPLPLHDSLLQLLVSLTLVHMPSAFDETIADIVSRCYEEADPDSAKLVQALQTLCGILEGNGELGSIRPLKRFLTDAVQRKAGTAEGKIAGTMTDDYSARMKTLVQKSDWDGCITRLKAWKKNELSEDGATYRACFDYFLDSLKKTLQSEMDGSIWLNDIVDLMPSNYDIDDILELIGSIDKRPCSSQPICRNPNCNHVTVKDLQF